MNELSEEIKEEMNAEEIPATEAAAVPAQETVKEEVPSMDDFKEEINNSFKKLKEGDLVKGSVIGVTETEVTVDLGSYAEGIIKLEELSNDPRFSIKADVAVGETYEVYVLGEDKNGNILLSKKKADDILAWKKLKEMLDSREVTSVKIAQAVNAGVVTYLNGVRAFIPASQIGLSYIENLETVVGQTLDVIVITVDEEKKRLVLSGKEVARDRAAAEKTNRINNLQKGLVTTGKVEKLMPFGAFVNIGDGLSGLVHISQISRKRIKTPGEVLKEGDEVKVKILDIKDGKVSLSMRAVEEKEPAEDRVDEGPREYRSGGEATTGLGSLLSGIKLD